MSTCVPARLYDGQRAAATAVVLEIVADGGLEVRDIESGEVLLPAHADCKLESPLGGLPRIIRFANGGMVEIPAADFPAEWESVFSSNAHMRRVHLAEQSRYKWIAALAGIFLIGAFIFFVALPFAAKDVASRIPDELTSRISTDVMRLLDRIYFDESGLPASRQQELEEGFAALVADAGDSTPYRILFRRSKIGPNAFALPGGEIVMTDELVELVDDDNEVYLVMAHELGHIHHHHGMRMLLQNAAIVVGVAFFLGDMSSTLNLAGALPAVLMDTGYSRKFEFEADAYAAEFGIAAGVGVEPMVQFFERIEKLYGEEPMPWLSTHPPTSRRIEHVRRVAEE